MDTSDRRDVLSSSDKTSSRIDRFLRNASLTALVVLAFLGGSLVTVGETFPGPQIARAYQGARALYDQLTSYRDTYRTNLWVPERSAGAGVTAHDPQKAQDGLTLYTSGHAPAAFLIDMDGQVLHEWRRPFGSIAWAHPPGARRPQMHSHTYFRNARVFPNGDLLVIYEGVGDTPFGYGAAKLDRNSEVVWSYPGRVHHKLDVAPDGRIYLLTHEILHDRLPGLGYLASPRLEDFLVVLSPEGQELRKIRLLDAFRRSRYQLLLDRLPHFAMADPLHANAVQYIDGVSAGNFAMGKEGQVLLSFREMSAIAVMDLDTEDIVWATTGPWIAQHDPDILPNGNILLFDNHGAYGGPVEHSRVIEFDPRTMTIAWQYAGTPEDPLASDIRGDQQRLPNGNTLINESSGGRILEVTRDGSIAWEFIHPVRGGARRDRIPIIAWAQRLEAGFFAPSLFPHQRKGPSQTEAPT